MKTRASCLPFAAIALAVAATVVGCSSGGAGPTPSTESTGSVEVALSAVGPDGATYSLPPMTTLLLSSPAIIADPYLNATTPTQSFSLPTGNYQVTLQGGTDAGAFVLNRASDGGTSPVTAYLVDKQPRAVTVSAGQSTPIVFHFTIPQIGNLVFSNGTLVASVQVDAGAASPPSGANVAGPLGFAKTFPGMNSAVNALFTPWDSPTEQISIAMTFTSTWTSALDEACTDGTATLTATPSMSSATDNNVAAFLSEINGAGFSVCVGDANNGGGAVSIIFERTGTPQSTAFQTALGVQSALFYLQLTWVPPTPIFDGTTLYLSQLSQPLTVPASMTGYVYVGNTYPVQFSSPSSPITLQITP